MVGGILQPQYWITAAKHTFRLIYVGKYERSGKGTRQILVFANAIPFLESVMSLLKFGSDCTSKPFSGRSLTWKKNQAIQAQEQKILWWDLKRAPRQNHAFEARNN